MAERLKLNANVRGTGSKNARAVRKDGKLPVVLYGHGQQAVAIAVNSHDFTEGLHHGHRLFDISIDGKEETSLVKDLQYDHFGKEIIHADLIRVNLKERVTVEVPLTIRGTAKGQEDDGGILDQHMDALEIECVVTEIPEAFEVDVREMEVGDNIHASDIKMPQGVTLITEPDSLIVNCHIVTEAPTTDELEEEMPAAPELVGKEDQEQEQPADEKTEESKEE